MKISELREHQAFFNYKEYVNSKESKESKELLKLRKRFVKDYPIEKIRSLSLDEYVVGKGLKSSFCYRIETELNLWGNIHGSTARKFGVYYGTLGDDKNKKYRIGKHSFGSNIKEAFINVKEQIIELIENKRDLETLKKNNLSPMFKGKILSLYYPDEFLNTFSFVYLDHFINNLSLENNSKSEIVKQKVLLDFKKHDEVMKDWNTITFNQFLYDSIWHT
ncbi:hypothetical protein [Marinomonas sp.]|uniref:hypothetical protein n=1 Tax=Marinomonas sp. TaxID=1904862 RepID=UPI003A955ECE